MSERPRHGSGSRPGDRLVRVGALVFGVGAMGVLGLVVPFFLGRESGDVWAVLAALTPLGLALALVGLLRGARAGRS